jgi:signal transduction histidine kinase
MKIGIRTKLLALLVVIALLPLTAALIAITVGSRQLHTEQYGQAISSAASVEAIALGVSLSKDIEKFYAGIQYDPEIVKALSARDELPAAEVVEAIEASWGVSPDDRTSMLWKVLNNDVSRRLGVIRKSDPQIAEILLTDRSGVLVAATHKTSDYFQADEDWWRGAWDDGRGRIYTPPVNFDQSVGLWAIDVCIPVRDGKQVVGVAKLVLDISAWVKMRRGDKAVMIGTPSIRGSLMLVRRSGEIFYDNDRSTVDKGALSVMKQWYSKIAFGSDSGWRFTDDGILQGFAPLVMPDRIGPNKVTMPYWSLVMGVPSSEVLKPVRDLGFSLLLIGLTIIVIIFVVGIFLVERGLVRRIRWLGAAANNVSEGDLSHRIQNPGGLWGLHSRDEIDQLTDDFNAMLGRVDKSHRMLTEANELKTNFIRVAGHELRTPVAYIMATTKLLEKSNDADRLKKAVAAMGAKSRRLAEIIESIFKLLPEQGLRDHLDYDDVVLPELLEDVYLDCRPFIDHRRQKLIIETGDDIPSLRVDRAKLCDVLENLIVNSVKFSPDGGTIRLRAGKQLGGYVSITIEDQGPGISPEDLPHVFDPFYSTRDVMKHSTGNVGYQKRGIGLGLAIVRHFVEMHGGDVHVSSSSEGSVFTVTIPIQPLSGDDEPN